MDKQLLKQFYEFKGQREAVRHFMIETLKEIAIERAFDGKDVNGIPEARLCIEKMFDHLEELYGIIEKPVVNNSR